MFNYCENRKKIHRNPFPVGPAVSMGHKNPICFERKRKFLLRLYVYLYVQYVASFCSRKDFLNDGYNLKNAMAAGTACSVANR